MAYISKHWRWLIPLILFVLYAPFSAGLDLYISGMFYHPNEVGDNRFVSCALTRLLYEWGPAPAWVAIIISISLILLGLIFSAFTPFRTASVAAILILAIGSGLIIHMAFKEHWGRPRPRQVVEFGGEQAFRPFYVPEFGNPVPSKSFCCGHCSMGFFFFAAALIGQKLRRRWLSILGYLLAFGLGVIISWGRVAQGAHFFSDVLTSALVMWWTALVVCWWLFPNRKEEQCMV